MKSGGIMLRGKFGSKLYKGVLTAFLALLVVVFVFPIVMTTIHSFKTPSEIKSEMKPIIKSSDEEEQNNQQSIGEENKYVQLKLIPSKATLNAYYDILLAQPQFLMLFWNSMRLTAPIVAGRSSYRC